DLLHLGLGQVDQLLALEPDRPGHAGAARQELEHGEGGHRLAAAALADHADDLALLDLEREVVDDGDRLALPVECHTEVRHRQVRLFHSLPSRRRGTCHATTSMISGATGTLAWDIERGKSRW